MVIKIIAFGIAKDILRTKEIEFEMNPSDTILVLRQRLMQRYPEFTKLNSLSFAVGIDYQDDTYALQENDEVIIIPPVSGG